MSPAKRTFYNICPDCGIPFFKFHYCAKRVWMDLRGKVKSRPYSNRERGVLIQVKRSKYKYPWDRTHGMDIVTSDGVWRIQADYVAFISLHGDHKVWVNLHSLIDQEDIVAAFLCVCYAERVHEKHPFEQVFP
jgi:predicted  nucleic acid-binding Zn-ribbon protein